MTQEESCHACSAQDVLLINCEWCGDDYCTDCLSAEDETCLMCMLEMKMEVEEYNDGVETVGTGDLEWDAKPDPEPQLTPLSNGIRPASRDLLLDHKVVGAVPYFNDADQDAIVERWCASWDTYAGWTLGAMCRAFLKQRFTKAQRKVVHATVTDIVRIYTDATVTKIDVACTCNAKIADLHDKDCPIDTDPHWRARHVDWSPIVELLIDPTYCPQEPCRCKPQSKYCNKCGVRQASGKYSQFWRVIKATTFSTPKCRHYRQPVELPDGTVIYCSSHYGASTKHKDLEGKPTPRFGMYAASSWSPDYIHIMVPWQDYGLPRCDWDHAIDEIERLRQLAMDGEVIEIGCQGGHGRTGTMLGVFALLSGADPKTVVKWVHEHYCKEAIESKEQEWWLQWVYAHLTGGTPPPKPKAPPKPKPTDPAKNQSSLFGKEEATKNEISSPEVPAGDTDPFAAMRAALGPGATHI